MLRFVPSIGQNSVEMMSHRCSRKAGLQLPVDDDGGKQPCAAEERTWADAEERYGIFKRQWIFWFTL